MNKRKMQQVSMRMQKRAYTAMIYVATVETLWIFFHENLPYMIQQLYL